MNEKDLEEYSHTFADGTVLKIEECVHHLYIYHRYAIVLRTNTGGAIKGSREYAANFLQAIIKYNKIKKEYEETPTNFLL